MSDQMDVVSSDVKLDDVQQNAGATNVPLSSGSYIETNSTGEAKIKTNGNPAARVFGKSPTNIYVFPPNSLTRVYYNNSYRYQLTTPNGYIGIRG